MIFTKEELSWNKEDLLLQAVLVIQSCKTKGDVVDVLSELWDCIVLRDRLCKNCDEYFPVSPFCQFCDEHYKKLAEPDAEWLRTHKLLSLPKEPPTISTGKESMIHEKGVTSNTFRTIPEKFQKKCSPQETEVN